MLRRDASPTPALHSLLRGCAGVVTIGNRRLQEPLPVFWPGVFRLPPGPEATTEAQPGPSVDPLVSLLIAFPLFSVEEFHPLPG